MNLQPIQTDSSGCKAPAALEIRVITGSKAVSSSLDERWDELLLKQSVPNPTSSAAWLRATIGLDSTATPLLITAESEGKLLGAGAFELKKKGFIRTARWLGGSGRPTITPDILVDPSHRNIASKIIGRLEREADLISLGPSRIGGVAGQCFNDRKSIIPEEGLVEEAWIVELPAPKIEKLKKKNASRLRRAHREGVKTVVHTHSDVDSIAPALERLFLLHLRRWEGRNDVSRFSKTPFYRSWTRSLVMELAGLQRVRIIEVTVDEQPAAMVLGFLFGRGALYHTPAVEPDCRLKSAGHIAMQAWVEAAMEAGAEVMNLGRGSGEPQGPKAALGPEKYPCDFFKSSGKAVFELALATQKRSLRLKQALFNVYRRSY